MSHPAIRPWVAIIGSVLAFAALIERAGLVPAVMVTVRVASRASGDTTIREALVFALCLALAASAIFVALLGQPFTLIAGV